MSYDPNQTKSHKEKETFSESTQEMSEFVISINNSYWHKQIATGVGFRP